jgi:hemerythrin
MDKVNGTLAFMKDYVVTHFRDEEAYQREIGYPALEEHIVIHQGMVKYVGEFAARYEMAGCDEKLVQQFGGKLLAWLINHVTFDDQKIAEFARGKGEHGIG